MTALRLFVRDHRVLAAWLVVLALAMKLAVPAGFMTSTQAGAITVEVCNGTGPMTIAIPGLPDKPADPGTKEQPCAFSGLSAPSLAGADPVLLVAAIAFVFAYAIRRETPVAARAPAYLRPPLRGPPAR
ncbi:DUF2946 family protein [Sphingomonas sp.]|uniref:DUF2946 family protein n=1 Tax=Sphingomonas sp. TaxID=28214 RepID=UPI002CBB478A|nr:DUF2946 family protein [Sphingomonas sp.]HWK35538.1 DUF2946 family protein [Sphingomonas sp.]